MAIDPIQAILTGASLIGGKALAGSDSTKPNVPPIGYQGGIPDIKYVREQVPIVDEGRRPGSYGQRYFTQGSFSGQENPYTGGVGTGTGTGTGGTGGGIDASDVLGAGLLGYGAYKTLGGPSIVEGAKNLLFGSGTAGAAAGNAVVSAGSNLVPNTGVVKAGGDGFNYVYGASLKDPALQGMTQQQIAAMNAGKVAAQSATKAAGAFGTGGTSGIGALPTASQLAYVAPYLAAPFLLDPIGKHIISPIAEALGFGSAERERKAEATKALQDSGFFATKDAIKSVTGKDQTQYIQEAQEVLTQNPYKRSIQGLPDTDDGRLEAEAMSRYYSEDPRGKAEMASYYARNPDFFTPDGKRRFPDDVYGDMQRASAEYNATSPYPQGGIGISPMQKVAEMAKNGTLEDAMEDRETFNTFIRSGIGTPGASSQGIGSLTTDEVSDEVSNTGDEVFTPLYSPEVQDIIAYNEAQKTRGMAEGGIVSNAEKTNGLYLGGITDGMADEVAATVDGEEAVRLSDGEYVIPADVVSHLGNGNSDAGAKQLKEMMNKVRMDRTGTSKQGKEINPDKYLNRLV